jgi:uncharacterized membrane protein
MGTEITREPGQDGAWTPRKRAVKRRAAGRPTAVEIFAKDAPVHYSETQRTEKDRLTQSLGWFSIALGAAEVLAPQAVARAIGMDENEHATLLRTYGLRELAAGVGILTRPKPTYWMWNRVLGDMMDLATLGKAMRSSHTDKRRLTAAAVAVLGVTAVDMLCSLNLTSESSPAAGHDGGSFMLPESRKGALPVTAIITVNKTIEDVYNFWKNPENFSLFMGHIDTVRATGPGRSHWTIKGPADLNIEWDAEVSADTPNESISWRSVSGDLDNSGTVRFRRAAGGRGTEVELNVEFKPKGGEAGKRIAKFLLAIPKTQLMNDLRRFKQLLEVGEIVKSDASVAKGMHPARPSKYSEMEG